jgi:hypothetical protein
MEGSNSLYIVMPIVMTLVLVVLIALPFIGARNPGHGHSSDTHSRWLGSEGQIPDHSATRNAVGSGVTGLGHAQDDAAADDENARRTT